MTQVDAQYRQQARSAAINICSQVLPMDKLPTALKEAYNNLFEELLDDKQSEFKQAWDKLPPSAAKLLPRADFHGFFYRVGLVATEFDGPGYRPVGGYRRGHCREGIRWHV